MKATTAARDLTAAESALRQAEAELAEFSTGEKGPQSGRRTYRSEIARERAGAAGF